MANDIARHDAANLYQKRNVDELEQQMREFKEGLGEGDSGDAAEAAPVEEGYSSMEIAAESGAEEPAAEADAAEPDLAAVMDTTPEEEEPDIASVMDTTPEEEALTEAEEEAPIEAEPEEEAPIEAAPE